jgi:cob(I)alamin adenosyltransferase
MAKIYTKTGDKGLTSLVAGSRIGKAHVRIEAYGNVDELNAHIGLIADFDSKADWNTLLHEIQEELFVVGSQLANNDEKMLKHLPKLSPILIEKIESQIDIYTEKLPKLTHFILPGGSVLISQTHLARTVCRRTEREVIKLSEIESIDSQIIIFLNRLSDYLFVLSRYIAFENNIPEKIWISSSKA